MNFESDDRIYKSQITRPCRKCGRETKYVAHGLHSYLCSPECLNKELTERIQATHLSDWVKMKDWD